MPSTVVPTAASSGGTLRSAFVYDLVGRQTQQNDYSASSVVYSRYATYDAAGKLTNDYGSTVKSDGTYSTSNWYSYTTSSGEYLLGAVASISSSNSKNGGSYTYPTTTNAYQWWDSAVQSSIAISGPGGTTTSSFYYDGLGRLTTVYISDGRSRTVNFRTDGDGQIIRRDEQDGNTSMGDPHEVWYRFGGRQMAYIGNNGTTNMSETASLAERRTVTGNGAFRAGAISAISYTDTTGSYDAVNSYRQGSSAGGYTVQHTGENLRGIAQALWGDASLWYKLAEANGLQADASLVEGQRLTVPAGVIRSTYNAGTVKPYNPADAIGNVQPTTPKPVPPKKKSCLGAIFLAIIAVVVAVVLKAPLTNLIAGKTAVAAAGAAGIAGSSAAGIAGFAGAAMAGSIVSQGIGVATGIQDKFSWGAVAMAGIGAAVGGALGGIGVFDKIGSPFLADVARGALGSAITQGIGVATGLQDKFSWAGVAAAGIGNGVGLGLAREMGKGNGFLGITADKGSFASDALSTAASTLANAATRSAIEGSNFGDNIMAALPDAIGGVLGRTLGKAAMARSTPRDPENLLAGTPFETAANPVAAGGSTFGQRVSQEITGRPSLKGVSFKPISPYAYLAPNFNDNVVHYGFDDIKAFGEYTVGKIQNVIDLISEEVSPLVEDIQEIVVTGARAVQNAARDAESSLNSVSNSILQFNIALDAKIAPYRQDPVTYLPAIIQPVARLAEAYVSQATGSVSSALNTSAGFQMPRAFDTAMKIGASVGTPHGMLDIVRTEISIIAHPEMITGTRPGTYGDVALVAVTAATAGRGAILSRAGFAARAAAMDGIAANSVDDVVRLTPQQVKAKIIGTAQQTGNDGAHAFRSYREAILLARNPEVEAVYLNKGYNAGLELAPKTISPNRRPDVLGRYFDGRVDRVEVFSRTDDALTLRSRNTFLDPQIRAQGFTPLQPRVVYPVRK